MPEKRWTTALTIDMKQKTENFKVNTADNGKGIA